MKNGQLTAAINSMQRAGLTLADALDPARQDDFFRAGGIGRKQLARLQEYARGELDETPAVRKPQDGVEVRRVQVMLDEQTIDQARQIGGGNLSHGLRLAVRAASRKV